MRAIGIIRHGSCGIDSELGCHVDGHVATAAHTVLITDEHATEPVAGPMADCYCAAYYASELVLCALRPGVESADLAAIISAVADCFHVRPVHGHPVLTLMKRFIADGTHKVLELDADGELVSEPFRVDADDVYAVNIQMTTAADGRLKESDDHRATIGKRNVFASYNLKRQSARTAMSVITNDFGVFPFCVRDLGDNRLRLGLSELVQNQLVEMMPVRRVGKAGRDVVAQFKLTAAAQESATWRFTRNDLPLSYLHSVYSLSEELQQLMDGMRAEVRCFAAAGKSSSSSAADGADAMECS